MKKLFLAALMITGMVITAQAQKGSILLYGNLDISTINNNGGGQFSINPGVGYQFSNSLTAGVTGGYNYYDGGSYIERDYKVGGFLRQATHLAGPFAYYSQFDIGYQNSSIGGSSNGSIYAGLTPNIGVDLKKSFALNFQIGGITYGPANGNPLSKSFAITFGHQYSAGISKNFGGGDNNRAHSKN